MKMEKIKIKTDEGEREVELKNLKGRHVKKALKLMTKIQREDGSENLPAVANYTDYLDELASELSGISVEELDDLDIDEKNKIIGKVQEKISFKLDFSTSSLKPVSSSPKVEQG